MFSGPLKRTLCSATKVLQFIVELFSVTGTFLVSMKGGETYTNPRVLESYGFVVYNESLGSEDKTS